jgi:hypothetical protein
MELNEDHYEKLQNALAAAYREKERAEVGDLWQIKAMSRIRRIGPLNYKTVYLVNLEQLVWRFAPFACALILIFSICLFNMDFAREYEMAQMFLDDPVEYTFVQSFGI